MEIMELYELLEEGELMIYRLIYLSVYGSIALVLILLITLASPFILFFSTIHDRFAEKL